MSAHLNGWRWVPVEATEEMLQAAAHALLKASGGDLEAGSWELDPVLKAAFAAAPHPPADGGPDSDLYSRLESLSKALEGKGRIDEHDHPDAYGTILDAMRFVAAPPPPIAQPDVLRAAAEKARAALSDLLLKRDPIVYSDALRALDEALAQAPIAQPQAAGWRPTPAAWLHTVRATDSDRPELDAALSFAPDNFPLAGMFESIKAVPLYQVRWLTEGALMGVYMEFDHRADKAWRPAEYLMRFAAAVQAAVFTPLPEPPKEGA